MKRRILLILPAILFVAGGTVGQAQQPLQHRIAYVATIDPVSELREDSQVETNRAFFSELRSLGYIEGQNIIIERYSVNGHTERHPDLAREVVGRNPEAIVTANNYVTRVYKEATSTIPIVSNMGDPVGVGLVASLAHPGGNITGVSGDTGGEIGGKRLQVLKELIPSATKIAVLFMHGDEAFFERILTKPATDLGVTLIYKPMRNGTDDDFRQIFEEMARDPPDAAFVSGRSEFWGQRRLIVELAEKTRLPAQYYFSESVKLGGLSSYGADIPYTQRRLAHYVDRILKGAKPADLPIEQPTKMELAINLKTAKTLGLAVPPSVLARADEIVE